MRLIKIIFVVTLMLFAATGFAAKKEKTTICHVGNEEGPGGEVYLDDPGCAPHEGNGYFCPDAGKIDLIEVANANRHLLNPSHMYDGISDYLPEDIGASGEGKEDTNGDGIDDGCEPPTLACPCWDTFTESELVAAFNAFPPSNGQCSISEEIAYAVHSEGGPPFSWLEAFPSDPSPHCILQPGGGVVFLNLAPSAGAVCHAEAIILIEQIDWCP